MLLITSISEPQSCLYNLGVKIWWTVRSPSLLPIYSPTSCLSPKTGELKYKQNSLNFPAGISQCREEIESSASKFTNLIESRLFYLLAVWPWVSHLLSESQFLKLCIEGNNGAPSWGDALIPITYSMHFLTFKFIFQEIKEIPGGWGRGIREWRGKWRWVWRGRNWWIWTGWNWWSTSFWWGTAESN